MVCIAKASKRLNFFFFENMCHEYDLLNVGGILYNILEFVLPLVFFFLLLFMCSKTDEGTVCLYLAVKIMILTWQVVARALFHQVLIYQLSGLN